ncbi:MAG TPA: bifunctional DNA primase/polymerase [Verrucomicrobiae bacterium]
MGQIIQENNRQVRPAGDAKVDYARQLLARGLVCLPLRQNGRHLDLDRMGYTPLHLTTRQKRLKELCFSSITFQLAQRAPSLADFQNWFSDFSGNIGIVGGYQNLMILDFDVPQVFVHWQRRYAGLVAATPVVRSPHGFHVYLRTKHPTISTSLHYGFRRAGHVKALGGYVVSPPSQFKNGNHYAWLPGQSPLEVEPRLVDSLSALALRPVTPLKAWYDSWLKRDRFDPN